ncbi:hypothetical protein KP509_23G051200 [Ceratopteris richardii]|uniref:VQ domain-containing protein n=1 Tax=Ceratopteris richardii TaxID=49495 RepID=A0A8T2S256_CERRI|nr:hypothetical protein KP509_23G051200 [Ceratopteris richardii]
MRLPRELDRSERQRCPRIYVPLCIPQRSSPTFAVMELVGFTSPSASADLVETPTPASLTASMADNSSVQPCVPFSPAGGKHDLCNAYAESSSTLSRISGREIVPQRSSDKPMTEIKVAPFTSTAMKSSTSASQDMTHSVHMTTRGNVVHTTSMDFKDVVQKLTGAPGKSDDARAAGSPEGAPTTSRPLAQKTSSSSKSVSAYSAKLDAIKSLKKSFKLLHRRNAATIRSIKKLHAETPLTFQGSMQPAPSVSPVTPFTSFFDLACSGGDGSKKHQSSPCPIISSPSHQSIAESEHVSNTTSKSAISCGSVRTESASFQENRESPSNKAMAGSLLLKLFPESPPNLNQEATGSTFDLIEAPPT